MRKSHTIPAGVVLLFASQNLPAQTSQQEEFARHANDLFSSNIASFVDWFTDPSSKNLLLLLIGFSFLYFLSMLTFFILINRQVFSVKEGSLLAILLEDWLNEKEKILIPTTPKIELEEIKLEETKSAKSLEAVVIQLDVPNLDVLSMEPKFAKVVSPINSVG